MKQTLLILVLIVAGISCKEEITPLVDLNGNQGGSHGNGGGTDFDCIFPSFDPVSGPYASCLPALGTNTLDVVTWNIENFPKEGNTTVNRLKEILAVMNADIIGFEEIGSVTSFNQVISALPGWTGVVPGTGSQRVGYAYKNSEVTVSSVVEIFKDDASAFPRPPLVMTATHISGKQVTLIDLHLKCCDDGNSIPRRKDAAAKLKAYIDTNLADKAVIMMGDFNEDITQPEGNDVLTNFINDADHYRFADMEIAQCSEENWSYPSWPSHLDHMLITNELFDQVKDIRTLRLDNCGSDYHDVVSDHRPVLLRLE